MSVQKQPIGHRCRRLHERRKHYIEVLVKYPLPVFHAPLVDEFYRALESAVLTREMDRIFRGTPGKLFKPKSEPKS